MMSNQKTKHKIEELLREAIVIDGHSDILIPLTEGKMDITERFELPDPVVWQAPPGMQRLPQAKFGFTPHTNYFSCMGQYDVPRWREGGVNTQLWAIYLDDDKLDAPFLHGMAMVRTFHETVQANEDLMFCTSVKDIRRAKAVGKIGCVLTMEGAEALGTDPRMIDLYYKLGLRSASLTHTRRNVYAEGCWGAEKQGGLTPLGRELVQRMVDLNMVIDLVHISRTAYGEIMDMVDKPVIMSHSTPTLFASTRVEDRDVLGGRLPRPRLELPRDKEMLEKLANKGGVLGMIWILYRDLESAVEDIETALEVMGPDHIGLGSDLYGLQLATPGLEDISKLPNLLGALIERGHGDEMLLNFLGGNYLRVFEEVWGS